MTAIGNALGRRHFLATIIVCASLGAAFPFISPPLSWIEGLLFDLSLAARSYLAPAGDPPPVLVVAVDRRSLDAPELRDYPRTFFGPVWARTLDALAAAGARVVAFDLILSYSADRFQKGFDRPFLMALSGHADRVVLGRSAATLPSRNYMAALRFDAAALGLLEVAPDADGIHRRLPARYSETGGAPLPSLVAAALTRAGITDLPDVVIPAATVHPESLPHYALIDLLRCAEADPAALSAAIGGRIVFVGTTLAEEDRKRTSARFLARPAASPDIASSCAPVAAPPPDGADGTVAGVYLHAAAAAGVLAGATAGPMPIGADAVAAGAAAAAGALAGLFLAPLAAGLAAVCLAAGLWAVQVAALGYGLWLQAGYALIALVAATVLAYLVRFVVEESRRLRIQRAFGRYLAPSLVDRLATGDGDLGLGGVRRDVTIMFADLSGFTALSGRIPPQELVERTNEYLTLIVDAVDASGGYVDKFIGDAVMAIWGAPAPDADHPAHAVDAALAIAAAVAARRAAAQRSGEPGFDIKIGVNSGDAVVGNVGSENRYNYTAVGEAVNIAARLESLPGLYGCRIVVGPETEQRLAGRYWFREVDAVSVKGKAEPLRVYEPISARDNGAPPPLKAAYEDALAHYRARRFADAIDGWRPLADAGDGPSAVMAARAAAYLGAPPEDGWDGVYAVAKG